MNPEIIERAEFSVLGITARINPMEADYQDLWGNQFTPRQNEIFALAAEPGCYSFYFGTEQEGLADFIAGVIVEQGTPAPEGLVVRAAPGGQYAVFACTMATLSPTWGQIYAEWLPSSEYVEDESRPSYEYYAVDMGEGPDAPLTIHVPIVAK